MKKIGFTTKFFDRDVELEVIDVTPKIRRDAEKYANLAFQRALEEGYLLSLQIDQQLKDKGVVLFDAQKNEEDIRELKNMEAKLLSGKDGNHKLTKLEGRKLALDMRRRRQEMLQDTISRYSLYNKTVERYSDNERNQYYIYACTLDKKTNKPFFKSFEEFKENIDTQLVLDATNNFYKLLDVDLDTEKTNTEIKWLIKYGFMNDKLQLIDSKNRLCDEDFRLINENGRFIDENGKLIDKYGNLVDENGNIVSLDSAEIYQS